jgi:hypothetical protein
MPCDQAQNIIFIHIPKNAGKFVEDHFGLSANPGRESNQLNRSLLSRCARALIKLDKKRQTYAKETLTGMIDVGLVAQHLTLVELQLFGFLDRDLSCKNLLATVRNPYSRMLSIFFHVTPPSHWTQKGFEDFAESWPVDVSHEMRHNVVAFKRRQVDFLRDINGVIPPNLFIARVEQLEVDLLSFVNKSISKGIELKLTSSPAVMLPKATSSYRKPKRHFKPPLLMSEAAKRSIINNYKADFDVFGYKE